MLAPTHHLIPLLPQCAGAQRRSVQTKARKVAPSTPPVQHKKLSSDSDVTETYEYLPGVLLCKGVRLEGRTLVACEVKAQHIILFFAVAVACVGVSKGHACMHAHTHL